jgi:hypothetical protein
VVGVGSLVSSLCCAPSAAAELGARTCAAPLSSLCRMVATGSSILSYLSAYVTVQGRNIQNTLLEPRRNLACYKQGHALLNLVCMGTVHLYGVERLCRGEGNNTSHPKPSVTLSNDVLHRSYQPCPLPRLLPQLVHIPS